jgi:hypothetical protein
MATVNTGIPAIDYTSKDYSGFLASMLTYATTAFPEWTNQNPGALEVMLLESFARELDVLSYYGDRIVAESYIGTATQLSSVIQLAALLGYTPGQPTAATGTVTFQTAPNSPAVILPYATQVTTDYIASMNAPIVFETQTATTVPANGGTSTVVVAQGITQGSAIFTIGNNTLTPTNVTVELLGTSDGSLLQEFNLANNPVIGGSVVIYVQNPLFTSGNPSGLDPIVPWTQVQSLQLANSSNYAWAETVAANGVVTINFGDGVNGAIPAAGLNIYANYRVGGGIVGNLSSNQIIDIAAPITGVSIVGSSSTTGGMNAETIDQIRVNAPRAFTTQDRAVTLADYGNLAMSLPSISQANAIANSYNNITVYVAATGNTVPTQAVLDQVTAFLQPLVMAGTYVTTLSANFIPINIGSSGSPVIIGVSPRYSPSSIQVLATQAIQNLFAPANVVIGQRIPVSSVYSTLSAIPGVTYVNIPLMARSDATQSGANDILLRTFELPVAGNIIITASPSN